MPHFPPQKNCVDRVPCET